MKTAPEAILNEHIMTMNDRDGSAPVSRPESLTSLYRALGQLEGRIHGLESGFSEMKQEMKQSMGDVRDELSKLADSITSLSLKLSVNAGKEMGQDKAKFGMSHVFQLLMNGIAVVAAIITANHVK